MSVFTKEESGSAIVIRVEGVDGLLFYDF